MPPRHGYDAVPKAGPGVTAPTADIEVDLLGPVSVRCCGRPVPLGSPMQRTLFAVLVAHADKLVTRSELVVAVWGPDAPTTAVNSVYTYVARLRKALEPLRCGGARGEVLVSDRTGYVMRLAPQEVDRIRFETHLTTARRLYGEGDAEGAIAEFDAGLALWSGPAYAGLSGAFVDADRVRLEDLRFTAMADRIEILQNLGRHDGLVPVLSALVREHPLQERLRYLLIRAYRQQGRQADAVVEYHDLRGRLVEAQGIEPGDRLREQYEEVLRSSRPPATTAERGPAAAPVPSALAQLARDVPGYVGYDGELDHLTARVGGMDRQNEAMAVHVCGGPGVGKTAFAVRFAHRVAEHFPDGQIQIDAQGFRGGRRRPLPPGRALRRVLAALGASASPSADLDEDIARYRSAVADRRLLILLDDVVTADQVRPLLPGTGSTLVITTSRNSLAGLVARDGALSLRLAGLAEDEAVRLFSRVLGRPVPAPDLPHVRSLVRACGQVPLAVRIAAAVASDSARSGHPVLGSDAGGVIDRLDLLADEHASLRTAFGSSVRALSDAAACLFRRLGQLVDARFGAGVVEALPGVPRGAAHAALAELVDANLVQSPVFGQYRLNELTRAYARWLARCTTQAMSGPQIREVAEAAVDVSSLFDRFRDSPAG